MVPVPPTGLQTTDSLQQWGHNCDGGKKNCEQVAQRGSSSRCSWADRQNGAVSGVMTGRGRAGWSGIVPDAKGLPSNSSPSHNYLVQETQMTACVIRRPATDHDSGNEIIRTQPREHNKICQFSHHREHCSRIRGKRTLLDSLFGITPVST